jgi:hypothetical protein
MSISYSVFYEKESSTVVKIDALMNIPDLIFDFFLVKKYLNSLIRIWIPDPGSEIRDLVNPGSGIPDGKNRIRDKHPGSATLGFENDRYDESGFIEVQ